MEDTEILELYRARNESAISETDKKYGTYCRRIAKNILLQNEDAEECVNDTYFKAWCTIPPECPHVLRVWLGRVVRNIALNLWNKNHAKKRYAGMEELLDELADCLPDEKTVEKSLEEKELTVFLNGWLKALSEEDRVLFLRRYWYGESVTDLAQFYGITPGQAAKRLYRIRQRLKTSLESEGYAI